MGTNKERIEHLGSGFGVVQEGLQQMEFGMNDKLHYLKEALNWLLNILIANQENTNHDNHNWDDNDGGRQIISCKPAKL